MATLKITWIASSRFSAGLQGIFQSDLVNNCTIKTLLRISQITEFIGWFPKFRISWVLEPFFTVSGHTLDLFSKNFSTGSGLENFFQSVFHSLGMGAGTLQGLGGRDALLPPTRGCLTGGSGPAWAAAAALAAILRSQSEDFPSRIRVSDKGAAVRLCFSPGRCMCFRGGCSLDDTCVGACYVQFLGLGTEPARCSEQNTRGSIIPGSKAPRARHVVGGGSLSHVAWEWTECVRCGSSLLSCASVGRIG
jgi:hypothetical protein